MSFLFYGIAVYVVLVTSAFMGENKANEVNISYMTAFSINTLLFGSIIGYFKVLVLKYEINNNKS